MVGMHLLCVGFLNFLLACVRVSMASHNHIQQKDVKIWPSPLAPLKVQMLLQSTFEPFGLVKFA